MMTAEPLAAADAPARPCSVTVLVNGGAGEVLQQPKGAFAEELKRLFAEEGLTADVRLVKGKHLAAAAREVASAKPDQLLIVAGGDGTLSRLLPQLREFSCPIAVLPLGTLNLLARDLGVSAPLADAIRSLSRGAPREIDLGMANSIPFHSNAGLGFLSRMAREREGARQRYPFSKAFAFGVAAARSFMFTQPIEITVDVDGRETRELADAVLVTNNQFEGSPWRRARLDEGLLEVHLLRAEGFRGRLRAALAVWRGTWRDLPTLRSISCRSVVITRRRRRTSSVALDGEIHRLANPLTFEIKPGALRVIAPVDH